MKTPKFRKIFGIQENTRAAPNLGIMCMYKGGPNALKLSSLLAKTTGGCLERPMLTMMIGKLLIARILKSSTDNFRLVFLLNEPILRSIFYIVYCRYFFELMSHFSKDELEKEKLEEFSSPEGQVTSQTDGAC